MPEIKKNEDGTWEVKYDTGEVFKGDETTVLNDIAKSHESTKRWAQNIKAENENLKAQRYNPPEPPPQPAPAVAADAVALRSYLGDEFGQFMGYKNGEELKQELAQMKEVSQYMTNSQIAESFMLECPDFPSATPGAVDKLCGILDARKWEYNAPNLMAAHMVCVRQGEYKPLTTDEINMAANQQSSQPANGGRPIPPTPPQGSAPGGQDNQNPWSMSKDDLRKKVLEGGGLGAALMALKPGETFGS